MASTASHAIIAKSARAYLRHPQRSDRQAFVDLVVASRRFHRPWVAPPATDEAFRAHLASLEDGRRASFLVCRRDDHAIVGTINMNEIVRGVFQSAYLGYYALGPSVGSGYMHEGLGLVLRVGFGAMRLHRMEANIIPENERSARLVQRLGFRLEGRSPRYLKIGGRWRDHDRYALTVEDWRRSPR